MISIDDKIDIRWVKKVDTWSKRCTQENPKEDTVLIMEGRERSGKTSASFITAYMVKQRTFRDVHLFFHARDLINFAQRNKEKIIIWDEPALSSLTGDQLNKLNKDLKRLLMMCGKFRHFFIFNITDFVKFEEYITVERPHGMIHLFKGRPGHACYIRMKYLERLRSNWVRFHKRTYIKLKSHYMDFPNPKIIEDKFQDLDVTINGKPHCTLQDYELMKDKAIASIGDDPKDYKNVLKMENRRLKKLIATEPKILNTLAERANHYGVNERQLQRWAKIDLNTRFAREIGDRSDFSGGGDDIFNNIGNEEEEEDSVV